MSEHKQVGGTHYTDMKIMPWEALEAWMTPDEIRGYFKGEVMVYLARERAKGGDLDIRKAHQTLTRLVEYIDRGGERVGGLTPPVTPTDFDPLCEGAWRQYRPDQVIDLGREIHVLYSLKSMVYVSCTDASYVKWDGVKYWRYADEVER